MRRKISLTPLSQPFGVKERKERKRISVGENEMNEYFIIILLKGNKYHVNRLGPSTEPCGTP